MNKTNYLCNEVSPDMINMLSYNFSVEFFLSGIYDFSIFDDVIIFSQDNEFIYNPLTIRRIHNCAWRLYGENKDNITPLVLNYYYDMAIKTWMNEYMDLISKKYAFNVSIDSDVLLISRSGNANNGDRSDQNIQEIINVNLLSYEFFASIINTYLDKNRESIKDIKNHHLKIKNFVYGQLVRSIEKRII